MAGGGECGEGGAGEKGAVVNQIATSSCRVVRVVTISRKSGVAMAIQSAFTYMVHPGRSDPDPGKITGAAVPLEGKLFDLLSEVYQKSDNECDIDIQFDASSGKQENPCRSLITDFVSSPNVDTGRAVAHRLASVTTHRSGLGLLFLSLAKKEMH